MRMISSGTAVSAVMIRRPSMGRLIMVERPTCRMHPWRGECGTQAGRLCHLSMKHVHDRRRAPPADTRRSWRGIAVENTGVWCDPHGRCRHRRKSSGGSRASGVVWCRLDRGLMGQGWSMSGWSGSGCSMTTLPPPGERTSR